MGISSQADQHPLFRKYALAGLKRLSNGEQVPVPYHIYDGEILLLGGSADLSVVKKQLAGDKL